jgi:predicted RNase H-like nuclease (RuvC/YqgF family)
MDITDKIVANVARIFGKNVLTQEEVDTHLSSVLSFEELKAKATEEVKADFNTDITNLNSSITALEAEKKILSDDNAVLKARVSELEAKAAAIHTAGSTQVEEPKAKRSYENTDINLRVAAMRAGVN